MIYNIVQNNFTQGQQSERLLSRNDLPQYRKGLRRSTNYIPIPTGGLTRRFGSKAVLGKIGTSTTIEPIRINISNDVEFATNESDNIKMFTYSYSKYEFIMFIAKNNSGQYKLYYYGLSDQTNKGILKSIDLNGFSSETKLKEINPQILPDGGLILLGLSTSVYKYIYSEVSKSFSEQLYTYKDPYSWSLQDYSADELKFNFKPGNPEWDCVVTIEDGAFLFTDDNVGGYIIHPSGLSMRIRELSGNKKKAFGPIINYVEEGMKASARAVDCLLTINIFTSNYGYVTTGLFYQNRWIITGSKSFPAVVFCSALNDLENFSFGIEKTSAFHISPTSGGIGGLGTIRKLYPDRGLLIFTNHGLYAVRTDQSTGFTSETATPNFISLDIIEKDTNPVSLGGLVVFIESGRNSLKVMSYSAQEDNYITRSLTTNCPEIINDAQWLSYATGIDRLDGTYLLCGNSDGSLAINTILPEENVSAWSKFETSGKVRYAATLSEKTFLLVERESSNDNKGIYLEEIDSMALLDIQRDYDLPSEVTEVDLNVWRGKDIYDDSVVYIKSEDGTSYTTTVSGGKLKLKNPSKKFSVGFDFTPEVALLPIGPIIEGLGDARPMNKKIVDFKIDLMNEAEISVNGEVQSTFELDESHLDKKVNPLNGYYEMNLISDITDDNKVTIRQVVPSEGIIRAVAIKIEI